MFLDMITVFTLFFFSISFEKGSELLEKCTLPLNRSIFYPFNEREE